MKEALFYVVSSFWAGAVHAATPGHGKTIAAAYLVGARGKPIDAVILGVFVTLSHTSGIVLVGVLASIGSVWLAPGRMEAYLALAAGLLVVALGLWMLWLQRDLLSLAMGDAAPAMASPAGPASLAYPGLKHGHAAGDGTIHVHRLVHAHDHHPLHSHHHDHDHHHGSAHAHGHASEEGWHTHGWGTRHSHRLDLVSDNRPALGMLLLLAVAGGILPDPTALAILLAALSSGKVLLGLSTVLVFSVGFAATLVVVGLIAAQVGQRILSWLSSIWAVRVQIATTLLILGMGVVLTIRAANQIPLMPA